MALLQLSETREEASRVANELQNAEQELVQAQRLVSQATDASSDAESVANVQKLRS